MAFTIDQIVEKYVATRDAQKLLSDKHAAEMKPFNDKKAILEQAMLAMLNEQNAESVKTEHGTAYKSTVMSVTVDPDGGWDKVVEYILAGAIDRIADSLEKGEPPEAQIAAFRDTPEMALINRSVNKTAVKEIMEQQDGFIPPGVKTALITSVNVRRA